jgi:2Fe-2S ferredoxin
MVQITFVELGETRRTVEAEPGLTVMEVAVRNNVQGIAAECGGQCSCATCHVHVDEEFFQITGAPVDDEEDMLEFSDNRQPTSRLGCQIEVTEALDGMTVRVAGEEV